MAHHVHVWIHRGTSDARPSVEFEGSEHPRDKEGRFAAAHGASEGENEPLSPSEKQTAHAKLNSMEDHPHPWGNISTGETKAPERIIKPEDVGFHHVPGHLTITGVKHTGPRWGAIRRVPLHVIERGQPYIPKEGLKSYIENINSNPELPELVHTSGEKIHRVASGHTRIGAQALAGSKFIRARVYEHIKDPRYPRDPVQQVKPKKT